MQLVEERPNIELRRGGDGAPIVVLAFPYDPHVVAVVRRIPGRRFDWDKREWWAPVDDWAGVQVAEVVDRFPDLTTSAEVDAWLRAVQRRWIGRVSTTRHDGRGWFVLRTHAGQVPEALLEGSREHEGALLAPFTEEAAEAIDDLRSARVDGPAQRCVAALQRGEDPVPPARLVLHHGVDGERLKLDVLWDPDTGAAFDKLPGAEQAGHVMPLDPWVVEPLDEFLALHGVAVAGSARTALRELREEHAAAAEAIRRSRETTGEPIPEVAARLGGTLQPFQWAGVRYALDARRVFIADEQGLGKTVEALAALEADDAFPAIVVCPASLKLNWERETRKWLPHRSVAVVEGRSAVPPSGDITILNYEIVAAHRDELARLRPQALVVDESHYCKNPKAKRTQAVRRLASAIPDEGLRLALTGTPVLNHAEELISQLRVIGRLE
ncbi:MAG: SWI/SNF-related matrix-associated actin-dependent regulator of chromatin subfamily A-like protein 1, partial [Solirubrobacteraceae bacterium]|nr:SWI/SNF-related matrix-associated actin-dependent regulator of chromatin subfamily A-like protein 1 [Solirubrobacteraceae bacterium]